jgi:glucose 1-dehydrogenase
MNAPEGRAKSTRIFWDVTEVDFDFVIHINLKGTFFLTQDFVNHLRDTKRPGKIVNISSVHEELPFPHFSTTAPAWVP